MKFMTKKYFHVCQVRASLFYCLCHLSEDCTRSDVRTGHRWVQEPRSHLAEALSSPEPKALNTQHGTKAHLLEELSGKFTCSIFFLITLK